MGWHHGRDDEEYAQGPNLKSVPGGKAVHYMVRWAHRSDRRWLVDFLGHVERPLFQDDTGSKVTEVLTALACATSPNVDLRLETQLVTR